MIERRLYIVLLLTTSIIVSNQTAGDIGSISTTTSPMGSSTPSSDADACSNCTETVDFSGIRVKSKDAYKYNIAEPLDLENIEILYIAFGIAAIFLALITFAALSLMSIDPSRDSIVYRLTAKKKQ